MKLLITNILIILLLSCTNNKKQRNTDILERPIFEHGAIEISNLEEIESKYGYQIKIEETDSIYISADLKSLKEVISANINTDAKISELFVIMDKIEPKNNETKNKNSLGVGLETFYKYLHGSNLLKLTNAFERLDSNTLVINIENNRQVKFLNKIDPDPENGDVYYSYSHFDPRLNSYFIEKNFGEGGENYIILNKTNAEQIEAWSNFPIISPKFRKFATVSSTGPCSDRPNGFQIFSYNSNQAKLEFPLYISNFEPVDLIWLDRNSFTIKLSNGSESSPVKYYYYKVTFYKK